MINVNKANTNVIQIQIHLPGIEYNRALIDTGSEANILHSRLTSGLKVEPIQPIKLTSPDGTFLATVTKQVSIYWKAIDTWVTFLIADFDAFPIILGAAVVKQFIKFPEQIQFWNDNTMQLVDTPTNENNDDEQDNTAMEIDFDEHLDDNFVDESQDMEEKWVLNLLVESNPILPPELPEFQDTTTNTFSTATKPQFISTLKLSIDDPELVETHSLEKVQKYIEQLKIQFRDVLNDDPLPLQKPNFAFYHPIKLKDENAVAYRKPYKVPLRYAEELQRQLKKYLEAGFIEPSVSPFGAPVVMVPKANGEVRLCNDFRGLNKLTIVDHYSLPNLEDLLSEIKGSAYYSTIDLCLGYHQILIEEQDRPKTAFHTQYGSYQWVVMPFGLVNGPSTFQRVMEHVLQPYLHKILLVYLDDIIIFSKSSTEHMEHLSQVMNTLRQYNLKARLRKCHFFQKKIKFLGHTISQAGICPSDDKILIIKNYPFPSTPKEAQKFLGFCGFYRKFVHQFSKLARPLNLYALKKLRRSKEVEEAFEQLKARLINAPILINPEAGANYLITTDASDFAMGGVVDKVSEDGVVLGTVAFFSKLLSKAERNYSIREKELLAVVATLKRFYYFLAGHKINIATDHKSLEYLLKSSSPPSPRLARWLEFLSEFDISIQYITGKSNKADALSRDFTKSLQLATVSIQLHHQVLGDDFFKRVQASYVQDKKASIIYTTLKQLKDKTNNKSNVIIPKSIKQSIKQYLIQDNLLYFKGFNKMGQAILRLFIPTPALQFEVIRLHHDSPTATHYGPLKMLADLSELYFWPNMFNQIKLYVKRCYKCQANKPSNHHEYGLLKPLEIARSRWNSITMDFISGFRLVKGSFDMIWVICDRFTKRLHFIPISKKVTANELADLFIANIFKLHGLPSEIISDRDVLFTLSFWKSFHNALGTKLGFSTLYHPKTDGQTERSNRTLIQLLRALFDYNTTDWYDQLPIAEFAYNSHYHEAIGMSPFELDLGFIPNQPHVDSRLVKTSQLSNAAKDGIALAKLLEEYNTVALEKLHHAQELAEKTYNRNREELLLEPGDLVLVHRRAKFLGSSFKFTKDYNLYFGPFRVTAKREDNPNVYQLDLGKSFGKTGQTCKLVNVKNLRPFYMQENQNFRLPPNTNSQLLEFARNKWIKAIVGIDVLNQTVALTFDQCPEYHASIFKAEEAVKCIEPNVWSKLLDEFKKDCEDHPWQMTDTNETAMPIDASSSEVDKTQIPMDLQSNNEIQAPVATDSIYDIQIQSPEDISDISLDLEEQPNTTPDNELIQIAEAALQDQNH